MRLVRVSPVKREEEEEEEEEGGGRSQGFLLAVILISYIWRAGPRYVRVAAFALLKALTHVVLELPLLVDKVSVDLKGHEVQPVQSLGPHNGHVIGIAYRRAREVAPR